MTINLIEINEKAVLMDFESTLAVLKKNPNVFFSWGPHDFKKVGKILAFKVQGELHTGWVYVRLNGYDLFDVFLSDDEGSQGKSSEFLYIDQLTSAIDFLVETK